MTEAIDNDAIDVLNAGGEDLEHRQPPINVNPQAPNSITNLNLNIKRFRNILTQYLINDVGDIRASNLESNKDSLISLENDLKSHLDPSPNKTYSIRSKRLI